MKRTVRIIATVAAIALTIVIMCVGIFAAKTITLTSNEAAIKFTASDVSAKVTGTKLMGTGTPTDLVIPGGKAGNGVFTPDFESGKDYPTSPTTATVNLGDIDFTSLTDVYTLTLTVENTFTADVSINAIYTVTCSDTTYLTVTNKAGTNNYTSGTDQAIANGSSVTFTTTIAFKSDLTDAQKTTILESGLTGITFNFSLVLTRAAA